MPVVNAAIAAIFEEIADLLDIQGAEAESPGFGHPTLAEAQHLEGVEDV